MADIFFENFQYERVCLLDCLGNSAVSYCA